MLKPLLSSTVLLTLLCGPALAQPAQPAPPPRAPAASAPLRFDIAMTYGTEKNNYDLILRPDGCGSVEARGTNRVDQVNVCARSSQSGILIDVKWKLSAGTVSYETNWQTVLVRGGYVDGGATDDVRFTLAMK